MGMQYDTYSGEVVCETTHKQVLSRHLINWNVGPGVYNYFFCFSQKISLPEWCLVSDAMLGLFWGVVLNVRIKSELLKIWSFEFCCKFELNTKNI